MMVYIGSSVFLILVFCMMIWFVISQLRSKYASSIHVIWYLFSLSLVIAIIGFEWAYHVGAIDAKGNAGNEIGKVWMRAFEFLLSLQDDFYVLSALVALIIAPQLISYVLSGIFGCASHPRLISHCVSFFAWGMAKSSAIAAGALVCVSVIGWVHGWSHFDVRSFLKFNCFASGFLLFAFAALVGKASWDEIPILANSRHLESSRRLLYKVDRFMTRHRVG